MSKFEEKLVKSAKDFLVGKKIVDVYYMSEKDADDMMWNHRAIVIKLDDGSDFIPQCDDEGNDAGCLNFSTGVIIPSI